jgi:hypothetical protein
MSHIQIFLIEKDAVFWCDGLNKMPAYKTMIYVDDGRVKYVCLCFTNHTIRSDSMIGGAQAYILDSAIINNMSSINPLYWNSALAVLAPIQDLMTYRHIFIYIHKHIYHSELIWQYSSSDNFIIKSETSNRCLSSLLI